MRKIGICLLAVIITLVACNNEDDVASKIAKNNVELLSPAHGIKGIAPMELLFEWKHPGGNDLTFGLLYSENNGESWNTIDVGYEPRYQAEEGFFESDKEYSWKIIVYKGSRKMPYMMSSERKFTTVHQYKTGDYETYFYNGANKVPIVILGDAFVKEDLQEGGPYQKVAQRLIDYIFSVEPYKSYKEYFNAYIYYTESKHRGALRGSRPQFGKPTRTNPTETGSDYLKDTYFAASIDPYGLNAFKDSCYNCAKRIEGVNLNHAMIILMVNEEHFSGMTWPGIGNSAIAMGTLSNDDPERGAFNMLLHESAHGFAKLADEYEGWEQPEQAIIDQLASEHNAGRCLNVSSTNDPNKVPWSHLLNIDKYKNSAYLPIGIFEGGYSYRLGMYRSEYSSCMGAKMYSYFNAISREMIVKRILSVVGENYSFEKFLEKDVILPSNQVIVPSIKL